MNASLRPSAQPAFGGMSVGSSASCCGGWTSIWSHNPEHDSIDVTGRNFAHSKKFRDVASTARAAIVIDDLASTDPWRPRGIEIRGRAETMTTCLITSVEFSRCTPGSAASTSSSTRWYAPEVLGNDAQQVVRVARELGQAHEMVKSGERDRSEPMQADQAEPQVSDLGQ